MRRPGPPAAGVRLPGGERVRLLPAHLRGLQHHVVPRPARVILPRGGRSPIGFRQQAQEIRRQYFAPVARVAAIPWRIWAMPSSPWPCMARAQPRRTVPHANQMRKSLLRREGHYCRCLLVRRPHLPAQLMDTGRIDQRKARLRGAHSSCARVSAVWLRCKAWSGKPRDHRSKPDSWEATSGRAVSALSGPGAPAGRRARCLPSAGLGQSRLSPSEPRCVPADGGQGCAAPGRLRAAPGEQLLPELTCRLQLPRP